MATYIGVDGGGTKTRLLVQLNEDNPRFYEFNESIRFLENGYELAAQKFWNLLQNIDDLDVNDITSISIGLAGASIESEQRRFEQAIKDVLPGKLSVNIQSDASLSLGAAFGERPGMILIAGTGSVAIGKTEDGQFVRVGGWGRVLGDEGSGHAIGLAALRHYARAMDGRDEASKLVLAIGRVLEERYKVGAHEVRSLLARNELAPSEFALIVFEQEQDRYANDILEEAAEQLAELVITCSSLLHYRGDVRGIGSVASNASMAARVNTLISAKGLLLSPLDPQAPVEYALKLAREAA